MSTRVSYLFQDITNSQGTFVSDGHNAHLCLHRSIKQFLSADAQTSLACNAKSLAIFGDAAAWTNGGHTPNAAHSGCIEHTLNLEMFMKSILQVILTSRETSQLIRGKLQTGQNLKPNKPHTTRTRPRIITYGNVMDRPNEKSCPPDGTRNSLLGGEKDRSPNHRHSRLLAIPD